MPANSSGSASAPHHAPFDRAAFLSIRLSRDPDDAFRQVLAVLAECSGDPAATLDACSALIDGHGVESLQLATGEELHYVNKGDTYDATLCHVDGRGYFVSSWGDVYEAADRQREEQDGERRCSYCSEWTEPGQACSACGRDPATGDPWPEPLRHVRLETGHTLRTWDTGRSSGRGMMARTRIGYELRDPAGKVLFKGDDFGPGAATADDSDEALRGLLGFLFLRPGDTDRDYFAGYSAEQLAFARSSVCEQLQFLYSEEGPGTFLPVGPCECGDPLCPACKGACEQAAATVLLRVDMADETGTPFCEACAADALGSGVFRQRDGEDSDDGAGGAR